MDYFFYCMWGLDRARRAGEFHLRVFRVLDTQLRPRDLQSGDSEYQIDREWSISQGQSWNSGREMVEEWLRRKNLLQGIDRHRQPHEMYPFFWKVTCYSPLLFIPKFTDRFQPLSKNDHLERCRGHGNHKAHAWLRRKYNHSSVGFNKVSIWKSEIHYHC